MFQSSLVFDQWKILNIFVHHQLWFSPVVPLQAPAAAASLIHPAEAVEDAVS